MKKKKKEIVEKNKLNEEEKEKDEQKIINRRRGRIERRSGSSKSQDKLRYERRNAGAYRTCRKDKYYSDTQHR